MNRKHTSQRGFLPQCSCRTGFCTRLAGDPTPIWECIESKIKGFVEKQEMKEVYNYGSWQYEKKQRCIGVKQVRRLPKVGTKGGGMRFDIDCILALLPNTSSEQGTLKSKL